MADDQKLPLGKDRGLTPGEIELAQTVFGSSIDYAKVRVHHDYANVAEALMGDKGNTMTPAGEIYSVDAYTDDYSKSDKYLFIHEMTHVWQYQNKVLDPQTAALAAWVASGFCYPNCYHYEADPKKDLREYNLEQQASMVADYYSMMERKKDGDKPPSPMTTEEVEKGFMAKYMLLQVKAAHDKNSGDPGVQMYVKTGLIAFDSHGEPHVTQKYVDANSAQAQKNWEQQQKDDVNLQGTLRNFIVDPSYVSPSKPSAFPPEHLQQLRTIGIKPGG